MANCETSLLSVYKLFTVCNSFPIKKCGGRLTCRQAQMHKHLHAYAHICALQYASMDAHVHKSTTYQACNSAELLRCLYSCLYLISISWRAITSWSKGRGRIISISVDQDLTRLRSRGWQWRCEKRGSCNPFWGTKTGGAGAKNNLGNKRGERRGKGGKRVRVGRRKQANWVTNVMGDYAGFIQKSVWGINTGILNHQSSLCFINESKQHFVLMLLLCVCDVGTPCGLSRQQM